MMKYFEEIVAWWCDVCITIFDGMARGFRRVLDELFW